MIVTYAPESGEKQEWEWDPDRIRISEAELVERRFGDSWDQFKVAVLSGRAKARRVLLWHLMRRDQHTLRVEDVPDFYAGELSVEFTHDELVMMRDRVRASSMSESDREELLAAMDLQITTTRPADGADGAGKASLPTVAAGTG